MKILVSNPPIADNMAYYPYLWAILKTQCSLEPGLECVEWELPIFLRKKPDEIKNEYDFKKIDVLALSCYVWNWQLQLQIAKLAKSINPSIWVVAGGPEPPYKDKDFFNNYPEIDFVVPNEAELVFPQILLAKSKKDPIAGAITPYHFSAERPRAKDLTLSPYLFCKEDFLAIRQAYGPGKLAIAFETSRGCPYACSFCDWGSNTMSRVHPIPIERVRAEWEFIVKYLDPSFVFVMDANFGMASRDLEIANWMVDCKKKYGSPRLLYFSPSKKRIKSNITIGKLFYEADLIDQYTVSLQHADQDIMENINRSNIPVQSYKELGIQLQNMGIPSYVQLILGLPGDTPQSWFRSICETFEWGLHEETRVYYFSLLSNSPANAPDYKNHWKMKTRHVNYFQNFTADNSLEHIDKTSEIVVGCKSYDFEDWLQMNVDTRWLQALHNFGLTRYLAIYFRNFNNCSYQDFYRPLLNFLYETEVGLEFNHQYKKFLRHWTELPNMPNCFSPLDIDKQLEPEESLAYWLIRQKKTFYAQLKDFFSDPKISDLINFQEASVIDEHYDPRQGREVHLQFDWPKWLEQGCVKNVLSRASTGHYKVSAEFVNGGGGLSPNKILWHRLSGRKRSKLFAATVLGSMYQRTDRCLLTAWKSHEI